MATRQRHPLGSLFTACLAIALAWTAGFLDVFGWRTLSHVYTSHMTCNTASLAIHLAGADWKEARRYVLPILGFVGGLFYGAGVITAARRRGIHSSFSIALGTEIALLVTFIATGARYGVALLPPALGIQTVTVTRVAGLRVYTTYLTGSLSKFAEAVVQYAFWFGDRTRGRFVKRIGRVLRVTPRLPSAQHAAVTSGLWCGFLAGGICGAWTGTAGLLAPVGVLAATTIVDLLRPVAAADAPPEVDSAH